MENKELMIYLYNKDNNPTEDKIKELNKQYKYIILVENEEGNNKEYIREATNIEKTIFLHLTIGLKNKQLQTIDNKLDKIFSLIPKENEILDKSKLFNYVKQQSSSLDIYKNIEHLNEWRDLGGIYMVIYAYIKSLENNKCS